MLLLRSMSLFDWREVDRIQVRRYDFEVDRSVLLGLRPNFRFLWIRLEGGPVLFCRLAIRMGEDVYKRVLGQWRIGRSPEADHLQSVFFEHWDNVVLESGLHGLELPWLRGVGPQLENPVCRLRVSRRGRELP